MSDARLRPAGSPDVRATRRRAGPGVHAPAGALTRAVEVPLAPHAPVAVPTPWPEAAEHRQALRTATAAGGTARGSSRRVLVAGVGYTNLRDFSAGPALAERLRAQPWPAGVQVEDLSAGAIHVLHWLQQQDPPFGAAIFLAAVRRDRQPGSVSEYRWVAPRLAAEEVQERVAEAVTGVISLDSLLVVLGYFGALPEEVRVIEVEPRDHDWGPLLSPPVEAALVAVERLVRRHVEALCA